MLERYLKIKDGKISATTNKKEAFSKKIKTVMLDDEIDEINKCEVKKSKFTFFLKQYKEQGTLNVKHSDFCNTESYLSGIMLVRNKYTGNVPSSYEDKITRDYFCDLHNLNHYHAGLYEDCSAHNNCPCSCGYKISFGSHDLVSNYVIHYSKENDFIVVFGLTPHKKDDNKFYIPKLEEWNLIYKLNDL